MSPIPHTLTPPGLPEDAGERGKDFLSSKSSQSGKQETTHTERRHIPIGTELSQMTPHVLGDTGLQVLVLKLPEGHSLSPFSFCPCSSPLPRLVLIHHQPGVQQLNYHGHLFISTKHLVPGS